MVVLIEWQTVLFVICLKLPVEQHLRREGAFEPLIERRLFYMARGMNAGISRSMPSAGPARP